MRELDQAWWNERGPAGEALWSHNVAFQSADFEEPWDTEGTAAEGEQTDEAAGSAVQG